MPTIHGYTGGRSLKNAIVPSLPKGGGYKEYDIYPKYPIVDRGASRIIIDQTTEKSYCTGSHYGSYREMK